MNIAVFSLTSELHDKQSVGAVTKQFLGSLNLTLDFLDEDYSSYGTHTIDIIYVRTGGTEGIFKRLLPELQEKSDKPFYLLTSGKSNSLAASMEILSFLRQNNMKGEIIHGNTDYIAQRIRQLAQVGEAKRRLEGCRLGVIGKPSDWLISSHADAAILKQRLGITLIDIPMEELLQVMKETPAEMPSESATDNHIMASLPGANQIYLALRKMVKHYQLNGLTIRCFDLLTTVRNTGCLALAKLNAEGVVAGCEGDIPAMLTMMIVHAALGVSGFQANPAHINPETGEMLFAHCTIPLNMVERYEFDTHFESGIGVGIRGYMKEGPVTIVKVAGDLSRHFIAEGQLIRSQAKPDLCRTQQIIRLDDPSLTSYFLTNPIGNHHIIVPGHQRSLLEEMLR